MKHRSIAVVLVALTACLSIPGAVAAGLPAPFSLSRLKPTTEPPNWVPLLPASNTSILWYPRFMRQIPSDGWSVSAALRDHSGEVTLVYLNAGPKTGAEKMAGWPALRLAHLRGTLDHAVHGEDQASGVPFRGGKGSCVMDDYITPRGGHHYREIACFVQGHTTASVIVAAALVRSWPTYGPQLVRAVESWQVR